MLFEDVTDERFARYDRWISTVPYVAAPYARIELNIQSMLFVTLSPAVSGSSLSISLWFNWSMTLSPQFGLIYLLYIVEYFWMVEHFRLDAILSSHFSATAFTVIADCFCCKQPFCYFLIAVAVYRFALFTAGCVYYVVTPLPASVGSLSDVGSSSWHVCFLLKKYICIYNL